MTRPSEESRDEPKRAAARRGVDRLGDLLPETTDDERPTGWGDDEDADRDGQLRRDVPPHHG
jgi:hypothetical protein